MTQRYQYRRLGPAAFRDLLSSTSLRRSDFMRVSGRHSIVLAQYLGEDVAARSRGAEPSMGDVMLLELAARVPGLADTMLDIADEYLLPVEDVERGRT